jgi:LacI family transcriptional regulator
MRDIAAAAKVSQTTVSLVLNKRESSFISDGTRDRVFATAKELGYRPNQIARALATGRTNIIGLWIRSLHSSYYTQMVHDLDELITASSYSAIISRNTAISDVSIMQEFPMMSVDGIIAVDIPEIIDNLSGSQIPIVSIGYQSTLVADSVAIELLSGTIEAMQHLYDSGRRRIALLIDGPCKRGGGGDRMDGYLSFMREKEMPIEFITSAGQSHFEACEAIGARIQQGSLPEAVFCFNDDMALGASRALHAAGVRIPDDVALVGCDNIEECPYMEPPLSTIVHPRKEVCLLAWDFLQKRIADPDSAKQEALLSARFIARQSS